MANSGNNSAIARPYAQAIFEHAQQAGQLVLWSDALHAAGTVVSDSRVDALIGAPATDNGKLTELIADIVGKAAAGGLVEVWGAASCGHQCVAACFS